MKLESHLEILRREGYINTWHDRRVTAGADWGREIDAHLNSAHLILLLVSPDFIASDYCYDIEVSKALERHKAGEAKVIPIILRPCKWRGTQFGKLQALPKAGRPVTKWANQDEAFLDIVEGIQKVVEELKAGRRLSAEATFEPTATYSDAPQSADRGQWVAVLSGTINENDRPLLEAMVAHLRKRSKDATLTLLRVERGSIVLVLEGSRRGFDLISELIESGQFTEILGHQVEGIHWGSYHEWAETRLRDTTSSATKTARLKRPVKNQEISDMAYKQYLRESPRPSLTALIERQHGALLNLAYATLKRTNCVDPADHRQDVVHQGILKFLRAARGQKIDYGNAVNLLRAAVLQEGVRHGRTCRTEEAVDFDELSSRAKEFGSLDLHFDPMETISALQDLRGRLSEVHDPDLFFQYFVEGRTLAEIAEMRGQSAVKVQRGVKKLLKELGVNEED